MWQQMAANSLTQHYHSPSPFGLCALLSVLTLSCTERGGGNDTDAVTVKAGVGEEAWVVEFAETILQGEDVTRQGYAWAHLETEGQVVDRYVRLARYLLALLPHLSGERRKRAEEFLCDGGVQPRIEAFSTDAVAERLAEIEKRVAPDGTGERK